MLYQTLEPALLRYVKNRQTEIFPSEAPFTLRFLAQGEYNINYVLEQEGRKQVLRVNTASQIRQANQIKYEYDALQLLKDSGVTPKPLYLDDSKAEIPYGLLTMEYRADRFDMRRIFPVRHGFSGRFIRCRFLGTTRY
jgi:hypothetical protein